MEGFRNYLSEILSNYTYDALRQITKKLNSTASKKLDMITSIISFLVKPENHDKLSQIFPAEIQGELLKILPDKHLKCICDDVWKQSPLITCSQCQAKQHTCCMGNLVYMSNYTCISCQMIKLNPADELIEFLIYPFLINETRKCKSFTFSKSLKNEINEFKTGTEVQFRCVKVKAPGYQICWPKRGTLFLNQKSIVEFKERKHKKETSLDMSIMLTLGTNEVGFEKRGDLEDYCLAVVKIRRNSSISLFSKLSQRLLDLETSSEIMKTYFKGDKDIKACWLKISMKCQFTLQPIVTPARGEKCNHPSCFDLGNFIEQQQIEKYTWRCPICTGPAFEVYVDEFLLRIIEKYQPKKLESIEITEDGKIRPEFVEDEAEKEITNIRTSQNQQSCKRLKAGVEIISVDEDSQLIVLDD